MVQLIIFGLGVNITFLPMHFLGQNGFPRRISDVPDGYIGFNNFITLGTALTFISLVIFLYIISATVFNPRKLEINAQVLGRFDRIALYSGRSSVCFQS